jgi:hypothetical protein
MKSATIYIPTPDSPINAIIDPGSGVVGAATHDQASIAIYYEGNRIGADNLRKYAERISHAADRLFTRYPTVAVMYLNLDQVAAQLVAVGTIREKSPEEREEQRQTSDARALAALTETQRAELARRWEAIRSSYVIEWSNQDAAEAYGAAGETQP